MKSQFSRYLLESSNNYDFPLAASEVSGLIVREEIPNRSSISASISSYSILKGIREVPFTAFDCEFSPTSRIKALAEEIQTKGEINPLIVVVDSEGPYILEGAHRFEALHLLEIKSFPALVVIDEDDND